MPTTVTEIIGKDVYNYVIPNLIKYERRYKSALSDFFNKNHDGMFEIAPYTNIYYSAEDKKAFLNSISVDENKVKQMIKNCSYMSNSMTGAAAKETYVICLYCIFVYYLKKKNQQAAELTLIYMMFSGKFYASNYSNFWKYQPNKAVMDYVVNNMINDKFFLKSKGSIFGSIKEISLKIIETYKDRIIDGLDDNDVSLFLDQCRDRERQFLLRIAKLYYQAYENKNYLNFESDNLNSDGSEFRITSNDAAIASRITTAAVQIMINNNVDMKICNKVADENVRPLELKSIMESIFSDKEEIPNLYRVCNILICDFMGKNPEKSVGSVDFISYSFKEKPNTKDKYIIEMQNIIIHWLTVNSENYLRRKTRPATEVSYRKTIKNYIVMIISDTTNKR